jgi:hypothetical protein
VGFSASCTGNSEYELEPIATPAAVTLTQDGTEYDLVFTSDNREANFSGYGIFRGASTALAEANLSDNKDTFTSDNSRCFVSVTSSQISYAAPQVKIRLKAATAPGGYHGHCSSTDLLLSPGEFVSVRAYVSRDSDVWSKPATVVVP